MLGERVAIPDSGLWNFVGVGLDWAVRCDLEWIYGSVDVTDSESRYRFVGTTGLHGLVPLHFHRPYFYVSYANGQA